MPAITIIIPAYNEATRLPLTIESLEEFVDGREVHEVLFVDDGSTDATAALLEQAAARNPIFRLVSYGQNAGKGYAVRRGIMEAQGELILISDADLSTPLSELDTLLAHIDQAEVVIGSRAVDETSVKRAQPAHRQRMGKIFNFLMRTITGLDFLDTQCGFKLLRRDAARTIARHAVVDRFAWDVEFIMIACREGYRVREIPVLWFDSPESRVRMIRDSSRMLLDLLKMRKRIGKVRCSGR